MNPNSTGNRLFTGNRGQEHKTTVIRYGAGKNALIYTEPDTVFCKPCKVGLKKRVTGAR